MDEVIVEIVLLKARNSEVRSSPYVVKEVVIGQQCSGLDDEFITKQLASASHVVESIDKFVLPPARHTTFPIITRHMPLLCMYITDPTNKMIKMGATAVIHRTSPYHATDDSTDETTTSMSWLKSSRQISYITSAS